VVASGEDEIALWFEHDLYDQLQLLQLLDWFAARPPQEKLSLLCIGAHPEMANFSGLGQLTPAQLAALVPQRRAIIDEELALGQRYAQAHLDHVSASATTLGSLPLLCGTL
jgi:hypothetical protein